jgi:hypothetical protein
MATKFLAESDQPIMTMAFLLMFSERAGVFLLVIAGNKIATNQFFLLKKVTTREKRDCLSYK